MSPLILSFLRVVAMVRRSLFWKGRGLPLVLHSANLCCLWVAFANVLGSLCISIVDDGHFGSIQSYTSNLATSHHCYNDGCFPGWRKGGKEHHGAQKVRNIDVFGCQLLIKAVQVIQLGLDVPGDIHLMIQDFPKEGEDLGW